jgi:WXG100 family type VII secretion target
MPEPLFIKFNPAQITEVASFVNTQREELAQNIAAIEQRSNALRQSWNSDRRADSYYNGISQLNRTGNELANILRALGTSLNQAAGVYKTGETDVKKEVQKLPTEGVFRT